MEDSNLRGGVVAPSIAERVWGVPEKRKTTDGKRNRDGNEREFSGKEKREDAVEETEAGGEPEPEELGYGSNGITRKRNRQVDVII